MADLDTVFQLSCTLGGEEIAPDIRRTTASIAEKVADVMLTLTGEAAGVTARKTLWTGDNHATNTTQTSPFTRGWLIVDPDDELTAEYSITLEICATLNASTNIVLHAHRVSSKMPFVFSTSVMSTSYTSDVTTALSDIYESTTPPRITRIRVHNSNASQNIKVRLLLLK